MLTGRSLPTAAAAGLLAMLATAAAQAQSPLADAVRRCTGRDLPINDPQRLAACDQLVRAPETEPRLRAVALNNRAMGRRLSGNTAGALADFTAAIRLRPQAAEIFYSRGGLRAELGDLGGAIADWDESIRLEPRNAAGLSSRASLRARLGDHAGAMQDSEEALRIAPHSAIIHMERGILLYNAGDATAAAHLDQAVWLEPGFVRARIAHGILRLARSDLSGALEDFATVLRDQPENAAALTYRGIARHRLGEPEAADADLAAAIRTIEPRQGGPHAVRAGLAMLRGTPDTVVADLTEALRRAPESPLALQLRAILRARQGDVAGSAADAAAARQAMPRMAEIVAEIFGPGLAPP
jgi:tetratricopeptide (TPR) repeat protein